MPGAPFPYQHLFDDTGPATYSTDLQSYVLGLRVRFAVPGHLDGVRAFFDDNDTGQHAAVVWAAPSETIEGQALFPRRFQGQPSLGTSGHFHTAWLHPRVPVSVDLDYLVGVTFPEGSYWENPFVFGADLTVGDITAPADSMDTPNSPFHAGCHVLRPDASFNASWYGIDVLFAPD